jgi:hypothetical protein
VLKFSLHFLLTPLNKQFLAKQNGNLYIWGPTTKSVWILGAD